MLNVGLLDRLSTWYEPVYAENDALPDDQAQLLMCRSTLLISPLYCHTAITDSKQLESSRPKRSPMPLNLLRSPTKQVSVTLPPSLKNSFLTHQRRLPQMLQTLPYPCMYRLLALTRLVLGGRLSIVLLGPHRTDWNSYNHSLLNLHGALVCRLCLEACSGLIAEQVLSWALNM